MSGAAPSFHCPSCDVPLRYDESCANDSVDGLVDFADYYSCPAGCGTFEYERRRHRLRLVGAGYASSDARA
jgi:predicted nucleic acid-binding Zn ribbon protein